MLDWAWESLKCQYCSVLRKRIPGFGIVFLCYGVWKSSLAQVLFSTGHKNHSTFWFFSLLRSKITQYWVCCILLRLKVAQIHHRSHGLRPSNIQSVKSDTCTVDGELHIACIQIFSHDAPFSATQEIKYAWVINSSRNGLTCL